VLRCAVYFTLYLACELTGVLAAFGLWLVSGVWAGASRVAFLQRNVALQSWWANALYRGAERVFTLRTLVEGDSEITPGPILVFIRHVSQADTLLPVVYVTRRHGIALRFVLKRELLWDPCLDIVGNRLPNVFVQRGSGESAREIAAVQRLMDDLGPRSGVLIYPEGTRFTPAKRARALEKLGTHANRALVARASRLRHVLPPHTGGPLGLLERNPGVDAVFCAHSGLEGAGTPRDILAGALVGSTVRVRFWRVPHAEIPVTADARVDWLYGQWQRIDDWIGGEAPAETR
jgi:1-acyl-sn-glycerol-3-phosphate acyltransferase